MNYPLLEGLAYPFLFIVLLAGAALYFLARYWGLTRGPGTALLVVALAGLSLFALSSALVATGFLLSWLEFQPLFVLLVGIPLPILLILVRFFYRISWLRALGASVAVLLVGIAALWFYNEILYTVYGA